MLGCIVLGDKNAFPADFNTGKTIGHLKEAIKEKKSVALGNTDASDLKLWKVNVPESKKHEIYEGIYIKVEFKGEELDNDLNTIGDYFKENPTDKHIHIIVEPPSPATGKRKAGDSNEELVNKKLRQIDPEEFTPESISKFLEGQEGVKDDFTKPHKLCGNEFNFQRKGRDETLHKLFDCIVERYIRIKEAFKEKKSVGDKSFHPVLALQAAPGGGKSFFLDELAALKSEDFDNYLKSKEQPNRKCPSNLENAEYYSYIKAVNNVVDMLRNSIAVCITYNGHSTYDFDQQIDENLERGLVMRILWSYFFDDNKLGWVDFCMKFKNQLKSLQIKTAVESILLNMYMVQKDLFFFV